MRKLDRYLLAEFLAPLGLVVLGLASLVLMVQFVDSLPRLREWHASASQVAAMHLLQFPYLASLVLPVGVLLAALIALGGLARGSELAAMGAGGISRLRLAGPILAAALGLSLGLFALSESVVPETSARARYILKVQVEGRSVDWDQPWRENMAKNLPGGRQLFTASLDAGSGSMGGLAILAFDGARLARRIDAEGAAWQSGHTWILQRGVERRFDAQGREGGLDFFEARPADLGAAPRDFMVDSEKRPQDMLQLNLAQLSDIIDRLRATGADDRAEQVYWHLRISYPFSCLVLALLGVSLPYLFPSGKRALTGAALGLLVAVGCGMLYLVFVQVGISLGTSGRLPAMLSAWLGNLAFGAAGAAALWKVNR